MRGSNLWDEEKEKKILDEAKKDVLKAFYAAEAKLKPNWTEMFGGVYASMPKHLEKQLKEMKEHVEKYKGCYPIDNFRKDC